jgi:hypothetical protein
MDGIGDLEILKLQSMLYDAKRGPFLIDYNTRKAKNRVFGVPNKNIREMYLKFIAEFIGKSRWLLATTAEDVVKTARGCQTWFEDYAYYLQSWIYAPSCRH